MLLPTCYCIVAEGVTLSLNGAVIANDGYVNVDDIGEGDFNALLCYTNKTDCCRGNRAGEWFFPNRTRIGTRVDNDGTGHTSYFFRDRGEHVVRLKRADYPSERGRFYCEVPNIQNVDQTIYINIGMFSLKCHM